MVTRAERVAEGLTTIKGHEEVAVTAALNTRKLRRHFYAFCANKKDEVVVKVLAKLVNAALVETDDGLTFRVASPEVAQEILGHVDEQAQKAVHQRCLDYLDAEDCDFGDSSFRVHHLLGAEQFDAVVDLLSNDSSGFDWPKTQLASAMRRTLKGLMAQDEPDHNKILAFSRRFATEGRGHHGPRELTLLTKQLEELSQDRGYQRALEEFRVELATQSKAQKEAANSAKAAAAELAANEQDSPAEEVHHDDA